MHDQFKLENCFMCPVIAYEFYNNGLRRYRNTVTELHKLKRIQNMIKFGHSNA